MVVLSITTETLCVVLVLICVLLGGFLNFERKRRIYYEERCDEFHDRYLERDKEYWNSQFENAKLNDENRRLKKKIIQLESVENEI